MARYIDADKLIAHLKDEIKGCEPPFGSRANGKSIAYGTKLGLKSAISFAETLSTADVVSRSELAVFFQEADKKPKVKLAEDLIRDFLNCVPKRLEGHSQETEIGYLLAVNEMLQALHKLQRKYCTE